MHTDFVGQFYVHGFGSRPSSGRRPWLCPAPSQRAMDSQGDFAAIGDQDFLEHRGSDDHEQGLAIFHRLAILDQNGGHGPGFMRDNVVECLHRLDQQHLLAA